MGLWISLELQDFSNRNLHGKAQKVMMAEVKETDRIKLSCESIVGWNKKEKNCYFEKAA